MQLLERLKRVCTEMLIRRAHMIGHTIYFVLVFASGHGLYSYAGGMLSLTTIYLMRKEWKPTASGTVATKSSSPLE